MPFEVAASLMFRMLMPDHKPEMWNVHSTKFLGSRSSSSICRLFDRSMSRS